MKSKKMSSDKIANLNAGYAIINVLITLIIAVIELMVAFATLDCLLYSGIDAELIIGASMITYSMYNIIRADIYILNKITKEKGKEALKNKNILKYFIYCTKCSRSIAILVLILTIYNGGGQGILIISLIYLLATQKLFRINIENIKIFKGEN